MRRRHTMTMRQHDTQLGAAQAPARAQAPVPSTGARRAVRRYAAPHDTHTGEHSPAHGAGTRARTRAPEHGAGWTRAQAPVTQAPAPVPSTAPAGAGRQFVTTRTHVRGRTHVRLTRHVRSPLQPVSGPPYTRWQADLTYEHTFGGRKPPPGATGTPTVPIFSLGPQPSQFFRVLTINRRGTIVQAPTTFPKEECA